MKLVSGIGERTELVSLNNSYRVLLVKLVLCGQICGLFLSSISDRVEVSYICILIVFLRW